MSITLHPNHIELKAEIERKKKLKTDILAKYKPTELIDIKNVDLYFLLDLSQYRFKEIPDGVLFKKYRERIMKYHPNKYDERIFKAIREAYEIIKNPYWKKKYDWYFFEVDPTVLEEFNPNCQDNLQKKNNTNSTECISPQSTETSGSNEIIAAKKDDEKLIFDKFNNKYNDYFTSISIFSKNKNIPTFGDISTPKDDIKKFYSFYKNFESNRSFDFITYLPNYDHLSDWARDEHEQKYKKTKKMLLNEHVIEVRNIANMAERSDPRLGHKEVKININPKLLVNGWTESDLIQFEKLKKKCKIGNQIDWKKFTKEFKSSKKRTMKDFLIKNTQIENLKKEESKENIKTETKKR